MTGLTKCLHWGYSALFVTFGVGSNLGQAHQLNQKRKEEKEFVVCHVQSKDINRFISLITHYTHVQRHFHEINVFLSRYD